MVNNCQHTPLYDEVVHEEETFQVRETKCRLCGLEVVYTTGDPNADYKPVRIETTP